MKNPWYISESDAAARKASVLRQELRQLRAVAACCLVPGMPKDTQLAKLAARGFGAEKLRRLLSLMRQGHGG